MKILVLDVPGLHVSYLGCYGNDWVATPNIDWLASESVVFDLHIFDVEQPGPFDWTGRWTLPAAKAMEQTSLTLGQALKKRNLPYAFVTPQAESHLADNVHDVVARSLELVASECAFIWARLPSLAPPWKLPGDLLDSYCEEEDQPWPDPPVGALQDTDDLPRLQNTYAAAVTYVDAQLSSLFDHLKNPNRLDDTLICLTAPHGLPLGEHGMIGRARPWLHEEFVHLPLIVRLPRGEHAGLRVNALTQPVDLLPTILECFGIAAPTCDGHSLWPLIKSEVNQVRNYAVSGLNVSGEIEWALRTPEWALLLPVVSAPGVPLRQAQLYVKPDDRWEVNDVRQHHLELAEEMEKTLRGATAK